LHLYWTLVLFPIGGRSAVWYVVSVRRPRSTKWPAVYNRTHIPQLHSVLLPRVLRYLKSAVTRFQRTVWRYKVGWRSNLFLNWPHFYHAIFCNPTTVVYQNRLYFSLSLNVGHHRWLTRKPPALRPVCHFAIDSAGDSRFRAGRDQCRTNAHRAAGCCRRASASGFLYTGFNTTALGH
jgi:hypothetical protein